MIKILIIGGAIATIFTLITYIAGSREKKQFNDGYCTKCGHRLRHFDTTFTGDRGYVCDNCNRVIWISYDWVDKV